MIMYWKFLNQYTVCPMEGCTTKNAQKCYKGLKLSTCPPKLEILSVYVLLKENNFNNFDFMESF